MGAGIDAGPALSSALEVDVFAAATHALGRGAQHGLSQVAAQAAPTPLWKRKDLLPYFLIALVPLFIIGYDLNMRLQTRGLEHKLEALDADYDKKMKVKAAQSQLNMSDKQQQEQIHGLRQEHASVLKKTTGLRQLITRQTLIPGLLADLGSAVSDDIVIGNFTQSLDRRYSFYLSGWAASNTAAQLLINSLEKTLGRWNLSVESSRIDASGGSYDSSGGYTFEAWLTWSPAASSARGDEQ